MKNEKESTATELHELKEAQALEKETKTELESRITHLEEENESLKQEKDTISAEHIELKDR